MKESDKKDDELSIYVERMVRMMQLLRIYEMVLGLPPEQEDLDSITGRRGAMLAVVYSFYYSLIEDQENSINFFRLWRSRVPQLSGEIDALETKILPFKDKLRVYRNRFGFHGSISREHESEAFKLLEDHTGTELYSAILETRNLSTKLIRHFKAENQATAQPVTAPSNKSLNADVTAAAASLLRKESQPGGNAG